MKCVRTIGRWAAVSAVMTGLVASAGLASAAVVTWTGGGDGVTWTNPANWSSNPVLPGPGDDVTIDVAGTPTITLGASASVNTLNTAEALVISGGTTTLTIGTSAVATAPITLNGGAGISGGTLNVSAPGASLSVGTGNESALLGVAVTGDIIASASNARVRVGATTTFSRIRLVGSAAGVLFAPGATIGGEIRAEGSSGTRRVEMSPTGALTLGASGVISAAPGFTGSLDVGPAFWSASITTFTNNGTISNQSAGTITINPTTTTFSTGALSSTGGGLLSVQKLSGNVSGPTASGTGSHVSLAGTYTLNTNSNVGAGSSLTLGGSWTNTATINLSGTLNFGGGTTGGLGTINRTGGMYAVTGAFDNTGATLALSGATGDLTLDGGTITGGSVTCADGTRIIATSDGNNRLSNVAVTGDIALLAGNARVKVEGTTTFSNLRLVGGSTAVGFGPGTTITGNVIGEGASTSIRYIEMNGTNGTLTIAPGGSIRTVAGFGGTINVGASFWFGGNMTLVNNGLIASDFNTSSTNEVNVIAASTTTSGTLRVGGGAAMTVTRIAGTVGTCTILDSGSDLTLDGTTYTIGSPINVPTGATLTLNGGWTNASTITLSGQLNIGGTATTAGLGTINRTGGAIAITGTLNNSGSTLALNAATGNYTLNGTLSGGTVTFADGVRLIVGTSGNNRLQDVNVQGDVTLDTSNARVRLEGTTTFNALRMTGTSTAVGFVPGFVLNSPIIAEGANTGTRYIEMNGTGGTATIGAAGSLVQAANCGGTLSIGPGFWFGGSMTLVNNGLINGLASAKTLTINPATSYSGSGAVNVTNGTNCAISNASGTLGTLTLADNATNLTIGGTYTLSNKVVIPTGATLTLNGTWGTTNSVNVAGGTLNLGGTVNIAGLNLASFQRTGGTVNLAGTLDNTGNTLTLNSTTGSWVLLGGTISGGSVAFANGSTLQVGADNANRLLNVNVQGDVLLTLRNARLKIEGTTRFAALRFREGIQGVGFSPGYILRDPIVNESTVSGRNAIELNGTAGTFTINDGVSITSNANAGAELTIGGSWWYGGNMALTNNGTINFLSNSASNTINPTTSFGGIGSVNVSGGGTLSVTNASGSIGVFNLSGLNSTLNVNSTTGGSYSFSTKPTISTGTTLSLSGGWSLPQGANLAGGTVNLNGNFTTAVMNLSQWTRSGGTVNVLGNLDNTGATLALNSTTGPIAFSSASITGGNVTQTGSGVLSIVSEVTLTDVNVTPELAITIANSRVKMLGASTSPLIRLVGQGSGVGFRTGTVLTTAVVAEGGAGVRYVDAVPTTSSGPATLTIGPSGSIISTGPAIHLADNSGWYTSKMTFTNNGTLAIDTVNPSAYLFMNVTDVTNYDRASKTFTGGTWRLSGTNSGSNVINEGVVVGPNTNYEPISVTTNAANVTLASGAGFGTVFNTLTNNSGTLQLTGRTLATTPVGGTFTNSGTLTLTPSARLNITGVYTQTGAGTYNAQIGGTQASGSFGQINASGAANLAGALNATFTANRVCGNIYTILTSTNRSGTWNPANIPASDVDTVVFLFYPNNDARLAVSTTADFNFDGFVTFEDFDEFVTAFENGEARADFNQDGFLSFEDFDAFVFRFEAQCE